MTAAVLKLVFAGMPRSVHVSSSASRSRSGRNRDASVSASRSASHVLGCSSPSSPPSHWWQSPSSSAEPPQPSEAGNRFHHTRNNLCSSFLIHTTPPPSSHCTAPYHATQLLQHDHDHRVCMCVYMPNGFFSSEIGSILVASEMHLHAVHPPITRHHAPSHPHYTPRTALYPEVFTPRYHVSQSSPSMQSWPPSSLSLPSSLQLLVSSPSESSNN